MSKTLFGIHCLRAIIIVMEEENRKSSRRRQLKAAVIAFNNRHSTMPCVVREISDDGARIEAPGNMIPDTFELLIELDGLEAHCQVAWRRTSEVGVAFLAPPVKKAPRRAQVVDAVRGDKPVNASLRKKPIVAHALGAADIPPPPADVPPPPAEPVAAAAPGTRPEPGHFAHAVPETSVPVSPPLPSVPALQPTEWPREAGPAPATVHERATPLSHQNAAPIAPGPAATSPAASFRAPHLPPQVQPPSVPPQPRREPLRPAEPRPQMAPPAPAPRMDTARLSAAAPQTAVPEGTLKPAPPPIRLGLPPAGSRFPQGARFDLKPVSGLPPAAESAFHAAVTTALRVRDLAPEPGQPAAYSLTGLLSANRSGDTVTFAYLFDVTNRGGRPLHRIAGQESVNLYRERPVWNPIEGELSKRIAAVIAQDLMGQIGDAA